MRSDPPELCLEQDGHRRTLRVVRDGERVHALTPFGAVTLVERPRFPAAKAAVVPGACVAPTPGRIVQVAVAPGTSVSTGALIVVLEAMKMEHAVTAPHDEVVDSLHVAVGDQVEAQALLAVIR